MVIPALDEAACIATVVREVLATGVGEVIVVDNGSIDDTARVARDAGARVVSEPCRGYGRACAAGVAAVRDEAIAIAFLDGDGSDRADAIPALAAYVLEGRVDFAIGSRTRGEREPGSLSALQYWAGRGAGWLVGFFFGTFYSDMCPQRVVLRNALEALGMSEETYGWNLQMQILVARAGLRVVELPVRHRNRIGGRSKVSGNVRAVPIAAFRILSVLGRHIFAPHAVASPLAAHRLIEPRLPFFTARLRRRQRALRK